MVNKQVECFDNITKESTGKSSSSSSSSKGGKSYTKSLSESKTTIELKLLKKIQMIEMKL